MKDLTATARNRRRIVVGTDGSPAAQTAVKWALDEAERCDAELEVVVAWEYPFRWAEGFNEKWNEDREVFAADANKIAWDAVDAALGGKPRPAWIRCHAVQGSASRALLECSRAADLLVVGSRGRGGFAELLLGSVGTACVHHARCPVTVVPNPETAADTGNDMEAVSTAAP